MKIWCCNVLRKIEEWCHKKRIHLVEKNWLKDGKIFNEKPNPNKRTLSIGKKTPEYKVPDSLKEIGVEKIRMCYPDRYGDIGPGDDSPDNW
jgi:hypothetical protein